MKIFQKLTQRKYSDHLISGPTLVVDSVTGRPLPDDLISRHEKVSIVYVCYNNGDCRRVCPKQGYGIPVSVKQDFFRN